MLSSRGDFVQNEWQFSFSPLSISVIPQVFTPFHETKYQKPELSQLLKNELAKTWSFYQQSYYRHDLKRVCEVEEVVEHWYSLSIKPDDVILREETLATYGYHDVLDQIDELQIILERYQTPDCNLRLNAMQIGGIEPVRVLKLDLQAVGKES